MKPFFRKHLTALYFFLTFLISWTGVVLVIGADKFGVERAPLAKMPLLFLAMCAGPTCSSLLLISIFEGRQGLRELKRRLLNLNLSGRHALVLLAAPVATIGSAYCISALRTPAAPFIFSNTEWLAEFGLAILGGLTAGIFEEIGWTGFAIPRLREKAGTVATGLLVGFLWGLWHLPLFLPGDPSGKVAPGLFLAVLLFTHLPAYRVLMVWLNDRTESLTVAILMHTILTACTLVFLPADQSGWNIVLYDLMLAAAFALLAFVLIYCKSQRERTN